MIASAIPTNAKIDGGHLDSRDALRNLQLYCII